MPGIEDFKIKEFKFTNLETFILENTETIHARCFSHTHHSSDQIIGSSRVVINQHGYNDCDWKDNNRFNFAINKVIDTNADKDSKEIQKMDL